jgi:hypothetical protein
MGTQILVAVLHRRTVTYGDDECVRVLQTDRAVSLISVREKKNTGSLTPVPVTDVDAALGVGHGNDTSDAA